MTKVRCNEHECFNNQKEICLLEELNLNNTNDTFECFDMERQKDIDLRKKLKEKFFNFFNKLSEE